MDMDVSAILSMCYYTEYCQLGIGPFGHVLYALYGVTTEYSFFYSILPGTGGSTKTPLLLPITCL